MNLKNSYTSTIAVLVACLAACTSPAPNMQPANPASQHCVKQGGTLKIERNPSGGEFGVCFFEDNRQCEEWALMRGECPIGGIRVTGYATPDARYCAITGGRYTAIARSGGASNEQGTCTLPRGVTCDADEYFRGNCSKTISP